MASGSMLDRMKGAAFLDVDTYEEVEADSSATGQAAGVVAIAAVANAIGGYGLGARGIISVLLITFVGWLLWAAVAYFIGTRLFGGTSTVGELLRTMGFAHAPGVLYILGVIPLVGYLVSVAVMFWMLVCGVIAIRQALDFDTGKAVLTALLGWAVILVANIFIRTLFLVVP